MVDYKRCKVIYEAAAAVKCCEHVTAKVGFLNVPAYQHG